MTEANVSIQTAGEAGNPTHTATVPAIGSEAPKPANDFHSMLGDFAKDPAFKDFKDVGSLAKSYKETKSLVGQKLGIPGADATPESKAAFYKALGVPDDVAGYGLKAPEGLPPEAMKFYNEELLTGFQKIAKEINLTPAQAQALQKWNDGLSMEKIKGAQADITKSDEDFDAHATRVFGAEKAAKLEEANAMLGKYVSEETRQQLSNAPNSTLIAIAEMAAGLRKEYNGKEDKAVDGQGHGKAETQADLQAKARALMTDENYSNPFKNKPEHDRINAEIKDIYAKIAKM